MLDVFGGFVDTVEQFAFSGEGILGGFLGAGHG